MVSREFWIILLVGPVSLILWTVSKRRLSAHRGLPLPPGPKGLPLVGNAFDIPQKLPWREYAAWGRRYGDIVYFSAFGQHMLVLNSLDVVIDLLEKRSANNSDRLQTPMAALMGWDWWNLGFMPYGGRWREYKRAFNQLFNQTTVREYRPQLVKAARYLVKRLYNKPQDFAHHIRYSFGSSILSVVYGIQVAEEDDNYIATVEHALEGAEQGFRPGAFLVDFIPALKYVPEWVPGAEFQRKAAGWKKDAEAMKDVPWQNIVKDGDHTPVAMKLSELLSNVDASDFGEDGDEMSRNICAIAYAGGADTTVGAVHCFFLAMAIYPEVQRRAQQELTTVVGPNRMPEFSDWDSLPYISALCKESMRWQPTLPLSVAHRSLEDDEYRGYFIPAGSILIQNTWAILHDPEKYPDPERFNPERFLKDGRLDPGVKDVRAAFGAGRRICPGRYFSDMSLFITVASILHTFDISPPLDSESRPRKIEPAMGSGSMSHPLPFECSVKPRSKLAEAVALGDYSTEQR